MRNIDLEQQCLNDWESESSLDRADYLCGFIEHLNSLYFELGTTLDQRVIRDFGERFNNSGEVLTGPIADLFPCLGSIPKEGRFIFTENMKRIARSYCSLYSDMRQTGEIEEALVFENKLRQTKATINLFNLIEQGSTHFRVCVLLAEPFRTDVDVSREILNFLNSLDRVVAKFDTNNSFADSERIKKIDGMELQKTLLVIVS